MLSIQSCNNISISAPVVETERSDLMSRTNQPLLQPIMSLIQLLHVVETPNNQSTSNTITPATETTPSNNI